MFIFVFSVAVSRLFLCISHFSHFSQKIPQNCVGVCYSEQTLAGVEAPKTSPINKDSCFLSPFPCDEEALSAGVGENFVQISTPGSNFGSLKHHEASRMISSEWCPRLPCAFS